MPTDWNCRGQTDPAIQAAVKANTSYCDSRACKALITGNASYCP